MRGKRVVAILTVIMVVTSCVSESMPIYAEDFISEESETPEFFEDQDSFASAEAVSEDSITQVIAKLARLVRILEPKQGRIRAEHEFWNKKWITGHFRRTLISYGFYESGKS